MRRHINGAALPPRTHEELLVYKREHAKDRREQMAKRGQEWRIANRERHNAHRYLLKLRAMKNPRHHHVRKMAEICAKFPKKRICYT